MTSVMEYELGNLDMPRASFNLQSIPQEIKHLLFSYFTAEMLVKLSMVSKEFKTISEEPLLWKSLWEKDKEKWNRLENMEDSKKHICGMSPSYFDNNQRKLRFKLEISLPSTLSPKYSKNQQTGHKSPQNDEIHFQKSFRKNSQRSNVWRRT
jgi:hypothetical protein